MTKKNESSLGEISAKEDAAQQILIIWKQLKTLSYNRKELLLVYTPQIMLLLGTDFMAFQANKWMPYLSKPKKMDVVTV